MFSITFLLFHYFSRSSPPKKLQKQSPRCVPQKGHCLNYVRRSEKTRITVYFLQWDEHFFRTTPLGDCFWTIWKCLPLLFCHFTIFPEAVPQRNSRSSLPDAFFKYSGHLLRRTHLGDCFWNS